MEEQMNSNPEASGPESDDFFDQLESQVNSGIIDDQTTKVTQEQPSGTPEVTHAQPAQGSEQSVDWEKRYKDSTREAQKMNGELKDLKPFAPILNAMKNDSGLVEHVRDYLKSGGKPSATVAQKLNLPEDFVYDAHEAVTDPESKSAEVMQQHIDSAVNHRAREILKAEQQRNVEKQKVVEKKKTEEEFKTRHNMSQEQFDDLKEKAKSHIMTLDDVYYIINRDQTNQNVANATKEDMLTQMQNVRNVPPSASGAASTPMESTPDDGMFDAMIGVDGDVDNLFE
jgi:hypothetical protein